MAARKAVRSAEKALDPPPKVWPFPTWKGQPYKQPKQPKPKVWENAPEALI